MTGRSSATDRQRPTAGRASGRPSTGWSAAETRASPASMPSPRPGSCTGRRSPGACRQAQVICARPCGNGGPPPATTHPGRPPAADRPRTSGIQSSKGVLTYSFEYLSSAYPAGLVAGRCSGENGTACRTGFPPGKGSGCQAAGTAYGMRYRLGSSAAASGRSAGPWACSFFQWKNACSLIASQNLDLVR
jgi:hypothetical protein